MTPATEWQARTWGESVRVMVRDAIASVAGCTPAEVDWAVRAPALEGETFVVPVVVEPGGRGRQMYDPYRSRSDVEAWNRVDALLRANPYVKRAAWDSYNAALVHVYVVPVVAS